MRNCNTDKNLKLAKASYLISNSYTHTTPKTTNKKMNDKMINYIYVKH